MSNTMVPHANGINKANLVGKTFGKLTVTREIRQIGKRKRWECCCECGNVTVIDQGHLLDGHTKSCGCLKHVSRNSLDLTGKVYGRLTVLEEAQPGGSGHRKWLCKCECGNKTVTDQSNLVQHQSRSCGCLYKESRPYANRTHGMSSTRQYKIWHHMVERCTSPKNPAYPRYGGRGIGIDSAWLAFDNWWNDMKEGYSPELTQGRIDNDGPYQKSNCRWETYTQQARNRRSSRMITSNGVTMTIAEWAERTGISNGRIQARLARGWSSDDAVGRPVDAVRRNAALVAIKH